ncbi:cellulose binding domain-containing protein [Streptomyces sp. NPDC002133]|uniref:cellulose binding domain-containing protein n=1 Tax=Streptomyces sp. NPDC002133 TaxID=3154409 RepID=UPI0033250739
MQPLQGWRRAQLRTGRPRRGPRRPSAGCRQHLKRAGSLRPAAGDTNATDNVIRMRLQLVNTGAGARSLSGVEIRYWFADGAGSYTTWCDWAQLGCSNLTHSVAADGSATGAGRCLKVNVSGRSLAAGASTGEIQLRVHRSVELQRGGRLQPRHERGLCRRPRDRRLRERRPAWGTEP